MVWGLVTASYAWVFLPELMRDFDLTQPTPLLFLECVHLYFNPGELMGLDQTEMETIFFFAFQCRHNTRNSCSNKILLEWLQLNQERTWGWSLFSSSCLYSDSGWLG